MRVLIQAKIEPVDIREVDEDVMQWTVNDSIVQELHESLNN